MHVAENYALHCGAQLSSPHIPLSFYPVPYEKYVCICTQAEVSSKKYDYFQAVVEHLLPYLETKNIPIVHLSDINEPSLNPTTNFGQLTKKQNNYIASNSTVLITNDCYYSHAASALGTPVVSLFGPLYKDTSKPLWASKDESIFLESHRHGMKPSFKGDEGDKKSINLIYPEEVARAALKLLKIEHNLTSTQTLHIGPYYHTPVVEVIPTKEPENNIHEGGAINLRLDLAFHPEHIAKWAFNRKLNILTDQPIERKYLDLAKPHILQVMIEISDNFSPDYIKELSAGGYNLYLFSKDESVIKDLRFKFIDWDIHLNPPVEKKELDNHSKICDNTYFKSSKTVTENNKNYSSTSHWKKGIENSDNQKVIDCPEFWEDANHFRIYQN